MSWRGFLYMALGAIAGLGGLRGIRVATALAAQTPSSSRWAEFVEADLPFFSSVVDARLSSGSWMSNNLTPRGLVLNLSNDCWACFDLDLLRVTAVWRGGAVSPVSMSQGSYHRAGWKAPVFTFVTCQSFRVWRSRA